MKCRFQMRSRIITSRELVSNAMIRDCEFHAIASDSVNADDSRKRLVSLAAQKFVADLSSDAFHYARLRVSGQTAGTRHRPGGAKVCFVLPAVLMLYKG